MENPFKIVEDVKPQTPNSQGKGLLWPLVLFGALLFGAVMWNRKS